jgi:hypothetical protein
MKIVRPKPDFDPILAFLLGISRLKLDNAFPQERFGQRCKIARNLDPERIRGCSTKCAPPGCRLDPSRAPCAGSG